MTETNEKKHSPTPWRRTTTIEGFNTAFEGADGWWIGACRMGWPDENKALAEANAEHIVEAVNAHERLVEENARLREALEKITKILSTDNMPFGVRAHVEMTNLAKAALSAPPRNCDVGTPLEQAERFKAFCLPRVGKCCEASSCPAKHKINQIGIQYCQLVWAQLPYEAPAAQEGGEG